MADSIAAEVFHPPGEVNLTTIQVIHTRLVARYGSSWKAKFAGVPIEIVEKDWFHELQRLPLWAIDFALDNLPADFPPTAGQFRVIASRSPPPETPRRLPPPAEPRPDPDRLKAELGRLAKIVKARKPTDWIADLERDVANGYQLSIFQKHCLDRARENLVHRVDDEPDAPLEDSRRLDALKAAQSARVARYLRDHPELQP